jgi:phosphatidate cytidylyltransferase
MKQRIISGAILVAILIPTLVLGGYFTIGVLMLVSVFGIYEILKAFNLAFEKLGIITYIFCLLYYIFLIIKRAGGFARLNEMRFLLCTISFLLIALMVCYVVTFPAYKAGQIAIAFFSFAYAAVSLTYIYRLRCMENGAYLVWIIFIVSWLCDTCAYFTGVFCGEHKAFPVLSPKKTWEGCAGGVLGSVLISIIFALIFNDELEVYFDIPALSMAIIGFLCSIISMFGDLAASAIKREYGFKDYSNLIPGHGGIMDRFDSVIFVAPFVYYILRLGYLY